MNVRTILPGAAIVAAALAPAAALADMHVNAQGFERVVTSSAQGESCRVQGLTGGTSVTCPDGSRGTMVLYRHAGEAPVCQVDFWYQGEVTGGRQWRALLSHRNASLGICALHWRTADTLQVIIQPGL